MLDLVTDREDDDDLAHSLLDLSEADRNSITSNERYHDPYKPLKRSSNRLSEVPHDLISLSSTGTIERS
jgi:hypothetical protein